MAECAIKRGLHVMVAKPPVVSRQQHQGLIELARKHGVLCCVEFHKRFDPIYEDARNQISNLERFGHVSYFYAYMSQPKYQLETFKHWVAEKKSDISFYLNSHHIDMLLWCLNKKAVPVSVYASESTGIADECINSKDVLDTISLLVKFKYLNSAHTFHAVFTSSWVAPKAEVHSQQKFQCLGSKAEVRVDQAHRGYELSSDATGYTSKNPLYMNFTPDSKGNFIGVNGYGYKSFSVFAEACTLLNSKRASLDESGTVLTDSDVIGFDSLCSIQSSLFVTSILEAGAISLKEKKPIEI
jgi:D-galacturonate reductase